MPNKHGDGLNNPIPVQLDSLTQEEYRFVKTFYDKAREYGRVEDQKLEYAEHRVVVDWLFYLSQHIRLSDKMKVMGIASKLYQVYGKLSDTPEPSFEDRTDSDEKYPVDEDFYPKDTFEYGSQMRKVVKEHHPEVKTKKVATEYKWSTVRTYLPKDALYLSDNLIQEISTITYWGKGYITKKRDADDGGKYVFIRVAHD